MIKIKIEFAIKKLALSYENKVMKKKKTPNTERKCTHRAHRHTGWNQTRTLKVWGADVEL